MATIRPNRPSSLSMLFTSHKWLLFLSILVLLILSVTVFPIYLFQRLKTMEKSLSRFEVQATQYKHTIQNLEQQVLYLSHEGAASEITREFVTLRNSVEDSKLQLLRLMNDVKTLQKTRSKDAHDSTAAVSTTVSQLAVDLSAQKKNLLDVASTIQEHSAAIQMLHRGAQDLSKELLTKYQQAISLHTQNQQNINAIIEEIILENELSDDLESLREIQASSLESFKTQVMPEERSEANEAGKTEEKTQQYESMNPFDSSDEEETLELKKKDDEVIAKLLKKASDKMQEGLNKGKKQMEKAMDKVKAATKKMGEKVQGASSRLGGKIASQVQRIVDNGRKMNEYIKSIMEMSGRRSDGSFDEDFEL